MEKEYRNVLNLKEFDTDDTYFMLPQSAQVCNTPA